MADQQHRATAQQWRDVKAMAFGSLAYSTILELRDRIKALEAKDEDDKESWAARLRKTGISAALRIKALKRRIDALEAAQPAKSNHPEKPDSSLVEQVAAAIHPDVCADPSLYLHEARAAIRVVAAWLSEHAGGTDSPLLLEREVER
jgi:hypothetical protein